MNGCFDGKASFVAEAIISHDGFETEMDIICIHFVGDMIVFVERGATSTLHVQKSCHPQVSRRSLCLRGKLQRLNYRGTLILGYALRANEPTSSRELRTRLRLSR